MSKTTEQLKSIMSAGGVISLDIKSKPYSQILTIAKHASIGDGGLLFRNSELRTTKQLIELASYNKKNNITFEVN